MPRPSPPTEALLRNPFGLPDADFASAAARMRRDGRSWLAAARCDAEPEAARGLLLALGHAQALQHPDHPARVLPAAVLDARGFRQLGLTRGELLPVVMAAGRCHRALCALRGQSDAMRTLRRHAWSVCFGDDLRHVSALRAVIHDHDVLLLGETGTGKEAVAHALAQGQLGPADGKPAPAAAVNAAAISDTLMDSELFGHVRGAFTGAVGSRGGLVRRAHRGTLFLDEVGDLPLQTQVKLLRVMETNRVAPLGSDRDEEADVRYIAATHRDLSGMVEAGSFRRDFFQRIGDRVLRLPPLRERPEDIVDIGLQFVDGYLGDAPALRPVRARAEAFLSRADVRAHHFAGNVRELQNMLRGLMLGDTPDPALRARRAAAPPASPSGCAEGAMPDALGTPAASLRELEDWYIGRVLAHTDGNMSEAARILDIDRSTVARRSRGR